MILVLMGVSGSGKTTVGRVLARELGWPFHDADDEHPPENVAKMRRGEPLTDADREPWLDALHALLEPLAQDGRSMVLACSALKQAYRDRLTRGLAGVRFVHLRGEPELLRRRLAQRKGHYMPASLLQSQIEALEVPHGAITVDVDATPQEIAARIEQAIARSGPSGSAQAYDPREEYERRLADRRERHASAERSHRMLARARLATFLAGVAMAWMAFDRGLIPVATLLVPVAVFVALVVRHLRVAGERDVAAAAVRFYERGLARLGDGWPGSGPIRTDLVGDDHLYAADLDVFGRGSLFDLICDARTESGERVLASWLAAPATPEVVHARQAAVAEVRPRLDLREDLAALGGLVRGAVVPERLVAWGARPAALTGASIPAVAATLSLALIATLLHAGRADASIAPFLIVAALQTAFLAAVRGRMTAALRGLDQAGRELTLLRGMLLRLERERFTSPLLATLIGRLGHGGTPASRLIRALELRVDLNDSGRNLLFMPIALVLLWPVQLACAIDRWRARHGGDVEHWIVALAEIEALCSLAGHAWEHPADPFPEIVADGPLLEADGIGHPLLLESRCVRNAVSLGTELRALIISGSNMSGKSTLLRTTGLNVVLALAGGTVRARRLRVAPLWIGASIRVGDSLLDGRSRFQAEILRLRQITDLARAHPQILFLLDEILHGTNSHDRRIGSEAVVRKLLELGAIGLVTTHDLALAEIASRAGSGIANVHFEDHVEDGVMRFDYRMRDGVVTRSNALALMRAAGLEV